MVQKGYERVVSEDGWNLENKLHLLENSKAVDWGSKSK